MHEARSISQGANCAFHGNDAVASGNPARLARDQFLAGGGVCSFSAKAFLFASLLIFVFGDTAFSAEATNSPAAPLTLPQLPDAGPSVLRVMGALALVLGIFLGGVWVFRNWQRLTIQRGRAPKLNVIERRPLGGKHALYVIGYEQERFLLASSPAGVNLLSHLPSAEAKEEAADETPTAPAPSFAQALTKVLKGK